MSYKPSAHSGSPIAHNKTSLYVAGAASEIDRARAAVRAARDAGFEVVSTWIQSVDRVGASNPVNASVADRCQWSTQCLYEVRLADALWFLVPTPPITTRGGWGELCYAHALRRHLVCSGPQTSQSIFCALGEEFETDESALYHLRAWSHDRRLRGGLRELAQNAPHDWPGPLDLGGEG